MPASLLSIVATLAYRTGFGVIIAVMPVLAVQQLGWTDTGFSQLKATSELIGAVIGIALGGLLARRLGSVPLMKLAGLSTAALLVAMGLADGLWTRSWPVTAFTALFSIVNILCSILFGALMMSLCWKRVAATQFGLYMAVGNVGLSVGAALAGPLISRVSYPQILYAMGACYACMAVTMHLVNQEGHQARVDALERRETSRFAKPVVPSDLAPI
jgi:PAT family beta-lactamase induction signal transducer AmpG